MGILDIFKKKQNRSVVYHQQDGYVKLLFRLHSDIFDKEMVETMWATIVDEEKGSYKLDNIPFYAPSIASDDIVFAEFDDHEQMFAYRETIEYSGNSTIQVVILDQTKKTNDIRDLFKGLGCVSEKVNGSYFSMEIPMQLDYNPIKQKLDELKQKEVIGYTESCLSEKHKI